MVETVAVQKSGTALPQVAPLEDRRHSLWQALSVIRTTETSATRTAVFQEIARKNRLIRFVNALYESGRIPGIRRAMLAAYYVKSTAWLKLPAGNPSVIAVATFGNEVHAIDRVCEIVPEAEITRVGHSIKNALHPKAIKTWFRAVARVPKIWSLLGRLAQKHDFMPAARMTSGLAYYMSFYQTLYMRPDIQAVVVASNYSPDALGLSAAAHALGLKVIYVNHAPVPRNMADVPPVYADCAVVHGEAIIETYESRSACTAAPVLIGQETVARQMEWREDVEQVGIFLTALTSFEAVSTLVDDIKRTRASTRILIRHHPVALLETDLTPITKAYPDVQVTLGTPLDDDILACDVVFCGNSGVALNTLGAGRPVAYYPALDSLPEDYNGFRAAKLVPGVNGWSLTLYDQLKTFYTDPAWIDVMRSYDAAYLTDRAELEADARLRLLPYLKT